MTDTRLTPSDLLDLSASALLAAGASRQNAEMVAAAVVRAELDGIASHGAMRIPYYAEHMLRGRVDGKAVPRVARDTPTVVRIDAAHGFAYPAIAAGLRAAEELAPETGIAAVAISRSHHSGVLGHHAEQLAEAGLVGIVFSNATGAIAAPGGTRPVLGTNPVALAFPRGAAPAVVVDLSMSVATRGRIALAAKRGEPIPEGWALDTEGRPTTDPRAAMAGTMVAIGGPKGAALAMALDLLVAGLTGADFSFQATPHFDLDGPPYSSGHLILAADPRRFRSDGGFPRQVEAFCAELLAEPDVRLPGARRIETRRRRSVEGIPVAQDLLSELRRYAAGTAVPSPAR